MKRLSLLILLLARMATGQVSFDRILHADDDPANWLTYSGSYRGQRYSRLNEITTRNVARLKPKWVYQMRDSLKVEASPLVIDGVLYFTEDPSTVTALDARTGRTLWNFTRRTPPDARTCCGPVNRGLAALDDALFVQTLDSHVIALDKNTGRPRWDVPVADNTQGYAMTGAPLVVKDVVIVGVSGGEFGIRGFLDAYDAKTGQRRWRLYTVPAPGEPGSETWEGDSWKTGGAPTWVTGSYDPELDLIYWGTGNPSPDFDGDDREGDNLYSNCLLAIEADTGKLRWHFQHTPHDTHDWKPAQVPVLFESVIGGRERKLVAQANRNGFYYVLDRTTGEFLAGRAFVKQTWAKGLDAKGRPILAGNFEPTREGRLIYPGPEGATNFFSPSYSPKSKLFYVLAHEDLGQYVYKTKMPYKAGERYDAGGYQGILGAEPYAVIRALVPETGALKWERRMHAMSFAGLLSTAGGVVFGGNREGHFFALNADTGEVLWKFQTGAAIWANPITYELEGKQQVAIAAGRALFVFGLDP